jgi:toxin CptA
MAAPLLLADGRAGLAGRASAALHASLIYPVSALCGWRYQHNGVPQRVLAGSTFWPRLLALRLADADGGEQALALLPDSVAPPQWRALAWLAAWRRAPK